MRERTLEEEVVQPGPPALYDCWGDRMETVPCLPTSLNRGKQRCCSPDLQIAKPSHLARWVPGYTLKKMLAPLGPSSLQDSSRKPQGRLPAVESWRVLSLLEPQLSHLSTRIIIIV